MNYRTVLTVAAILSFLYGIGFMLLPGQLSSLYDVELTHSGRYVAQMYGATLFCFGLLNWFARDFQGGHIRRSLLTANTLAAALGFVFSLIAQLGGVPDPHLSSPKYNKLSFESES